MSSCEEISRKFEAYRKKADGWRRQYGASQSRERALKQKIKDLESENAKLRSLLVEKAEER